MDGMDGYIRLFEKITAPNSVLKKKIEEIMSCLSEREQRILRYRYALGLPRKTRGECARIFGVTRERIRQIEVRALNKLRHPERRKILLPASEADLKSLQAEVNRLSKTVRSIELGKGVLEPAADENISVMDMEITLRTKILLFSSGIKTIKDLVFLTEKDVLGIRNLGCKSLREIKSELAGRGYTLAGG